MKGNVWRRVVRALREGQEAELEAAEVKTSQDQEGGRQRGGACQMFGR